MPKVQAYKSQFLQDDDVVNFDYFMSYNKNHNVYYQNNNGNNKCQKRPNNIINYRQLEY